MYVGFTDTATDLSGIHFFIFVLKWSIDFIFFSSIGTKSRNLTPITEIGSELYKCIENKCCVIKKTGKNNHPSQR